MRSTRRTAGARTRQKAWPDRSADRIDLSGRHREALRAGRQIAEQRRVGARHPDLAAERRERLDRAPRAGADRDGRRPRRAGRAARCRSSPRRAAHGRARGRSAAPSARRSERAGRVGMSFGPVAHDEIGGLRADQGAAGRPVARRGCAQQRAIAILGIDAPACRAISVVDLARERDVGPGEGRVRRRASAAINGGRAAPPSRAARRRTATPSSAISRSTASSQRAVGAALLEEAVARAQRPLQRVDARAVLGVDRQHQPVEEAAAVAGRAGEQPVEVGRQPDDAQMVGEGARRADRPRRRCGSCAAAAPPASAGSEPDAEPRRASSASVDRDARSRRRRPARAISARSARRRPRPGVNSESASRRLVLPAPFSPISATSRPVDRQIEGGIGAEIAAASTWATGGSRHGRRRRSAARRVALTRASASAHRARGAFAVLDHASASRDRRA